MNTAPAKALWQSRTLIGLAVAALAMVLDRWGYHISPDIQGDVVDLVMTGGEIGGLALATWGRIAATKQIKVGGGAAPLAVLLLLGLATAGPIACASLAGETPAQRLYGVTADYRAAQEVAVAYLESGRADAEAAARIKRLDDWAWRAVGTARQMLAAGSAIQQAAALSDARAAVTALAEYLADKGSL